MKNKLILFLIAIAIVVGGAAFYGGTVYQKSSLSKKGILRNTSSAQFGRRQVGSGLAGTGEPENRGNVNFITGKISSKNDNNITVQMRDGSLKIIFFSESTSIGKAVEGTAADLASDKQVMISGIVNADGTVTAQNIQIRPEDQLQPGPSQINK